MSNNIYKLFAILYTFCLTIELLIPLNFLFIFNIIDEKNNPNDFVSFIIHFVLLFFLFFTFSKTDLKKFNILIFCIIYSIIIEYLQLFTNRGFQFYDIFFNILGVLSAAYIYRNSKISK